MKKIILMSLLSSPSLLCMNPGVGATAHGPSETDNPLQQLRAQTEQPEVRMSDDEYCTPARCECAALCCPLACLGLTALSLMGIVVCQRCCH